LVLLGLVAVMGLGLALAGPIWRDQVAREREQEWLRIGQAYSRALTAYIEASPGTLRQGPERLEQLLQDERFFGTRRHLRALYGDPLQPGRPWALLRDERQRIVGVYSEAAGQPFLSIDSPQPPFLQRREGQGYPQWVFMNQARR
jgi:type II secretory pathway pseudopilin PulG